MKTIVKNELYDLTVTGMTAEGNGVGHIEENGEKGMTVFVPFSAVGDRIRARIVKVEKRFAYGIIDELLVPSPDRTNDIGCDVFGKCGGCVYRHIRYDAELRYKAQRVKDAFERIGGLSPTFRPILASPAVDGYRNKAQYPVTGEAQAPVIGFFAPRSHRVIPQRSCALQPTVFEDILNAIADWMTETGAQPYDEQGNRGLVRHIYLRQAAKRDEIMVCLVCTSGKLPNTALLIDKLKRFESVKSICVNINRRDTNVILGDETFTLFGEGTITDELCGKRFSLSPKSFY
ncbi:MAG: class I SAM-dependent RNA methyltransferase, partial [Clostridia bacterium]|nr:class I SAM-dependent RNA methyltransferase [Clostridia bacterium]